MTVMPVHSSQSLVVEAPEIERSQLTMEDDGFDTPIEWTIADPVIGLNYQLSWEYANGARLYDVETDRICLGRRA